MFSHQQAQEKDSSTAIDRINFESVAESTTRIRYRAEFTPRSDRSGAEVVFRRLFERMVFPDWSPKTFEGVPFHLVDPQGNTVPNAIMLNSPNGAISKRMPRRARIPCNSPAKAIHMLSGVSGWGSTGAARKTVTLIVRLHYGDGQTEDHELLDGIHFADYIRRIDVPGSKLAFMLQGKQLRYLAIYPKRAETIQEIEFVKGRDQAAPIVMAVTAESPS